MREQPNPQNLIDDATQLIQAARKGNLQDITAIRDRHTVCDFVSLIAKPASNGYNALAWASMNGHIEIVQLLLQALHDADVNTRASVLNHITSEGHTALLFASGHRHTEIFAPLLQAIHDAGADMQAVLNHANMNGWTVLLHASYNDCTEQVSLILQALHDAGSDIQAALNHQDADGYTPLMWASRRGSTATVQLLLQALHDAGADIRAALNHQDADGYTALMWASSRGSTATVQLLLQALHDAGADIQAALSHQGVDDGRTALMFASTSGSTTTAELLLQALRDAGADIQAALNHQDADGRTALMCASTSGSTTTAELLLQALRDAGADIQAALNHSNNGGTTPLMLASEKGHTKIVQLLLAYGASLANADIDRIARLIASTSYPAMPKDKLHSIMQRGDITWVVQDYANYSRKFPEDRDTLDQLTSWAIILGHEAFVETVLPLLGTLSLEAHTEYLRLALQAQKFAVAERLFDAINDQYGQDNKQTVCNYLLHLMEIERGPLPAIALLRQHGAIYKHYTRENFEESDRVLLSSHTLFQEEMTVKKSILPDDGNLDLRLGLFDSGKTLYHVACGRGDPVMLERIAQFPLPQI